MQSLDIHRPYQGYAQLGLEGLLAMEDGTKEYLGLIQNQTDARRLLQDFQQSQNKEGLRLHDFPESDEEQVALVRESLPCHDQLQ